MSSLVLLTAVNASAGEAKSADSGVANGDVVYFQDMKEFEPRTWDDGSRQVGIAYLATALERLRQQEGDPIVAFWWRASCRKPFRVRIPW